MALTPSRQRNAVSERTALGLLMCDRDELPYDKVAIDLAFFSAWREWPFRNRFPQVSTDVGKSMDGARAMTRADKDKHVINLYWENDGGTLTICPRPYWIDTEIDPDELASTIDGDVPAAGWKALAEGFLSRFERD